MKRTAQTATVVLGDALTRNNSGGNESMRVLVLQNYANTGLGQIQPALDEAGVGVDLRRLDEGEALPRGPDGYDGLIVLGGAQDALDDAASPYFPALLELVRRFEGGNRAVMGVCLGAQLIARAFGGENRLGSATEFGWREVALTPEARGDSVFGSLPARFPIFQWHDDTFTLPPGAVGLAANDVAVQAFRMGRATYGVQFHFEADRALVRHWSETFAPYLAERQPGWDARHEADEATSGAQADAAGARLARGWVAAL